MKRLVILATALAGIGIASNQPFDGYGTCPCRSDGGLPGCFDRIGVGIEITASRSTESLNGIDVIGRVQCLEEPAVDRFRSCFDYLDGGEFQSPPSGQQPVGPLRMKAERLV